MVVPGKKAGDGDGFRAKTAGAVHVQTRIRRRVGVAALTEHVVDFVGIAADNRSAQMRVQVAGLSAPVQHKAELADIAWRKGEIEPDRAARAGIDLRIGVRKVTGFGPEDLEPGIVAHREITEAYQ